MRQSKTKKLKKQVFALDLEPGVANKLYKQLKRGRRDTVPVNPVRLSKKMHKGESYENFRARRKVCNQKRRQREKQL